MPLQANFTSLFDARSYPASEDPRAQLFFSFEVSAPKTRRTKISADLVCVLDISGSMNTPNRYPMLRRALLELISRMEPDDQIAVVAFSTRAELLSPLQSGLSARQNARSLLERMDNWQHKFQGTNLSPGLAIAAQLLHNTSPHRARRVYVLTDGEIGDTEACYEPLSSLPAQQIELHAYGFGAQFNAALLKNLFESQLGGSVKPICNEHDIVDIFAHIAEVNGRIVARAASLTIELDPEVDAGDAFSFRPQERHLGLVQERVVTRSIGALEEGRVYSMLIDLRLPPAEGAPHTRIGTARLSYQADQQQEEITSTIYVTRHPGDELGEPEPEVCEASLILDALRFRGDPDAEVRATKARLALATRERRDPGLLYALQKQIDILEGRSQQSLNQADLQYIHADESSMIIDMRGLLEA